MCILAGVMTISLIACTTKLDSPEKIGRKMLEALTKNDVTVIKSLISDDFLVRECPPESSTNVIYLGSDCLKNLLAIPFEKRNKLREMANTSTCSIKEINEMLIEVSFIEKSDIIILTLRRVTPIENTSEDWKIHDFYIKL